MPDLVLVVGPPSALRRLEASCLSEPPLQLRAVADPLQAPAYARQLRPAAVVVVAGQDGADGLACCADLRRTGDFPLLLLARNGSVESIIRALEAGADDCLPEDITPRELRARLRAHLRRAQHYSQARQPVLHCGPLDLDRDRREARVGGRTLALSPKEFALLEHLALHAGRVMSRDELLQRVWDFPAGLASRTLDVHVSRLRHKLSLAGQVLSIETIAGVGYRLQAQAG